MNHASLFSGIGGFDLAAEWMGWNNVFHCEWNPFCQVVLKHHFPNSISYEDITKTDFTIHRGTIDVLTGGFPCQPYSVAGKRLGKEDERHLWPQMLRAIREIEPRFVVGENVRGLVNWNGGLVFDEVQADLENAGYKVIPFIIPACAVGAPHRRDRVWFVAYRNECATRSPRACREVESNWSENNDEQKSGRASGELNIGCGELLRIDTNSASTRQQNRKQDNGRTDSAETRRGMDNRLERPSDNRATSNTHSNKRHERRLHTSRPEKTERHTSSRYSSRYERNTWQNFPTQSPICGGDDGLPTELDGITFSKWRNESIKAYGNAIVPQVAFEIFKAIEASLQNE